MNRERQRELFGSCPEEPPAAVAERERAGVRGDPTPDAEYRDELEPIQRVPCPACDYSGSPADPLWKCPNPRCRVESFAEDSL
jgi:hypothetical protein